jgi:hypothetical protein
MQRSRILLDPATFFRTELRLLVRRLFREGRNAHEAVDLDLIGLSGLEARRSPAV